MGRKKQRSTTGEIQSICLAICRALAHPAQLMCWNASSPAPSQKPAIIPNETAAKRKVPGELSSKLRVGGESAMYEVSRPVVMGAAVRVIGMSLAVEEAYSAAFTSITRIAVG